MKTVNDAIWQWKRHWMGHVLRHSGLIYRTVERRMKGNQQEKEED